LLSVGSVCSGIEAASVAWGQFGFKFKWFSEIAEFPSKVLRTKYPNIPNVGDMNSIPDLLRKHIIDAPDIICGGTPCQAFSLAGWKNGLNDLRGNLTIKFVDIVNQNDEVRISKNLSPTIVFWENVEGVLTDKTNAFGSLIASLAGLDSIPNCQKWGSAGVIKGSIRNVAWRVLDAKYFGIPQQRRRLYLLAGGKDFLPENILFEQNNIPPHEYPSFPLCFEKEGHRFEVFREYTDCLYSAYGTKWNGNAAAYNGSLYVVQDERIRRLSPVECERLMGFPDNYTDLPGAKRTNRYQAIGNSWAVPVVKWIGSRIEKYLRGELPDIQLVCSFDSRMFDVAVNINKSFQPQNCSFMNISNIISVDAPEEIYISPTGCYGIVRRKQERKLRINPRLEEVLLRVSAEWSSEDIEKRSRVQKRGKFSDLPSAHPIHEPLQLSLWG